MIVDGRIALVGAVTMRDRICIGMRTGRKYVQRYKKIKKQLKFY